MVEAKDPPFTFLSFPIKTKGILLDPPLVPGGGKGEILYLLPFPVEARSPLFKSHFLIKLTSHFFLKLKSLILSFYRKPTPARIIIVNLYVEDT